MITPHVTPTAAVPQVAAPAPEPTQRQSFADLISIGASLHIAPSNDGPAKAAANDVGRIGSNRPAKSSKPADDGSGASAAAVPAQTQQAKPAQSGGSGDATAAPGSNVATGATANAAAATSGTQASAAALDAVGNGNGTNGSAAQPPGAAELNARIVAGAANLLSKPNIALAQVANGAAQPLAAGDTAAFAPQAAGDAAGAAAQSHGPASALPLQAQAVLAAATKDGATDAAAQPSHDPDAAPTNVTLPGNANAAAAVQTNVTPPTDPPANPVLLHGAAQQVTVNLKQAVKDGVDEIRLQLKPASLGAIDVKLNLTQDGKVTAVISADRSDTLNMLRQDASGLEQALRDAGLQADSGSLNFNLRGDPQAFSQNAGTFQGGGNGSGGGDASAEAGAPAPRLRAHAGALDIEV